MQRQGIAIPEITRAGCKQVERKETTAITEGRLEGGLLTDSDDSKLVGISAGL